MSSLRSPIQVLRSYDTLNKDVAGDFISLLVEDTLTALAALGRAARERSRATVCAVTGSSGKTSTKELLAGACAELVTLGAVLPIIALMADPAAARIKVQRLDQVP